MDSNFCSTTANDWSLDQAVAELQMARRMLAEQAKVGMGLASAYDEGKT